VVYSLKEQGIGGIMVRDANVGPAKGSGSQTGSFTGSKALEDIQKRRLEEAVERGKTQDESGEEKVKEKDERELEVDKLLPKKVSSVLGEVSFDTFKKMYKGIWDQVESKEHLAKGFCSHSQDLSTGLSVTLRTFRVDEARIINRVAPDPQIEFREYYDKESDYRTIQLILGVQEFDGKDLPKLNLPGEDFDKWRESDDVRGRFRWIHGLPEELIALMSSILTDITIAYRIALRENLKNQLAPL
jgi:hypothetical protein